MTEHGQRLLQSIDLADRAEMITGVRAVYVGLADSRTVEIIVDGEPMAFIPVEQIVLPQFNDGDEVIINYYRDQDTGQMILARMEHAR